MQDSCLAAASRAATAATRPVAGAVGLLTEALDGSLIDQYDGIIALHGTASGHCPERRLVGSGRP
jgi:hypothetical protein